MKQCLFRGWLIRAAKGYFHYLWLLKDNKLESWPTYNFIHTFIRFLENLPPILLFGTLEYICILIFEQI